MLTNCAVFKICEIVSLRVQKGLSKRGPKMNSLLSASLCENAFLALLPVLPTGIFHRKKKKKLAYYKGFIHCLVYVLQYFARKIPCTFWRAKFGIFLWSKVGNTVCRCGPHCLFLLGPKEREEMAPKQEWDGGQKTPSELPFPPFFLPH